MYSRLKARSAQASPTERLYSGYDYQSRADEWLVDDPRIRVRLDIREGLGLPQKHKMPPARPTKICMLGEGGVGKTSLTIAVSQMLCLHTGA